MEENDSVYRLITDLCGRFTNDPEIIRKYRRQAYEILLTHHPVGNQSDLESTNVLVNVYAWQFQLATKYDLKEHARRLVELCENVQKIYGDNIIKFLMSLRSIPKISNEFETFSDLPLSLSTYRRNHEINPQFISNIDDNVENVDDIWEIVSKQRFPKRRTWESYGQIEITKELFLSEVSGCLWLKNLPSTYTNNKNNNEVNNNTINLKIKTMQEFVNDLKYLLVGMASYSFIYEEQSKTFYLLPNITIDGVSVETLNCLCDQLMICGNYYKQLQDFITINQYNGKYKHDGYMFAELCKSINRYLEFYRYIIINLPNNIKLLNFIDRTEQIRKQLILLANICQIQQQQQLTIEENYLNTSGISFFNYLYRTILNQYDKRSLSALLSILYPMLQTYYCNFLQLWLFYGTIDDPFNEFFIQLDPELYIKSTICNNNSNGRYYWTKSFRIRYDIIPDFLENLYMLIFKCGQSMNLLKLCNQSSPLCFYLLKEKPYIFSSCFTLKQLNLLEKNLINYCKDIEEKCGEFFKLYDYIKQEQKPNRKLLELINKKRAITINRIELEQKKNTIEDNCKKNEQINEYKADLNQQLDLKQQHKEHELNNQIKLIEDNLIVEQIKNDLIEKEAKAMVEYYDNLCEIVDEQQQIIDNQIDRLKQQTPNLDVINANNLKPLETFETAKKIKEEVLKTEFDIIITNSNNNNINNDNRRIDNNRNLTEAQKNKLKVMGSEFGISLMESQINNNIIGNTNNKIVLNNHNNNNNRRQLSLNLKNDDDDDNNKRIRDKPIPMSIDSTPLSDLTTVSTNRLSSSLGCLDKLSTPETGCCSNYSKTTENLFNFNEKNEEFSTILTTKTTNNNSHGGNEEKLIFSKRMSLIDLSNNNDDIRQFKMYLYQSLYRPIKLHMSFVNSELLKYFFIDLNYLKHLKLLRNFYFLQDGSFAYNLTENLFEKLYKCIKPNELINCRILKNLIQFALDNSSNLFDNMFDLSFRINSLPKQFCLRDPNVLNCLSLVYPIKWPLNILLTQDTLNKYDDIFKYLLKLNRVSWVLKKIHMELKIFVKEIGKKSIYLISSPHYRKLHQYRYVMLHIIQTLQNYVIGEVLQPSWEIFLKQLQDVNDLDQLYTIHSNYIKNILFMCYLNQKSTPLRTTIENIFSVVLKFYDYLRSRQWEISENGHYIHPNFDKLQSIYENFDQFVLYFFKICRKVIKTGYQSNVIQLLDMLDINDYYRKKLNV